MVAEDGQELDARGAERLDEPVEEGPRAGRGAEKDVIAEQERDVRARRGEGRDDARPLGVVLFGEQEKALDEGRALQIRDDRDARALAERNKDGRRARRGRGHAGGNHATARKALTGCPTAGTFRAG